MNTQRFLSNIEVHTSQRRGFNAAICSIHFCSVVFWSALVLPPWGLWKKLVFYVIVQTTCMRAVCVSLLFMTCMSFAYGCVSEKGDHMGWPDSETNYKFVVHPREEIPVIS